jgi:hypothetical protein
MSSPPPLPRASLAFVALVHAVVLGAAARVLPWPSFSVFALLAGLTSVAHVVVAALAVAGHRRLATAWRLASLSSLLFLGWVTYAALSSGLYVARLYAGVGVPLAAAAGAAWCVVAFFTLPIACWGLAKTGGLSGRSTRPSTLPRDAGPLGLVVLVVLAALGIATRAASSRAVAIETPGPSRVEALRAALGRGLASLPRSAAAEGSLFDPTPQACPSPPGPGRSTIFATYIQKTHDVVSVCVQGADVDDAARALGAKLEATWGGGAISIDVATGVQALPDAGALLGAVILRPGLDGACFERSCLMPWQLVATDQFTRLTGFAALQLKVGVSAPALRQALGAPPVPPTGRDVLAEPHAGFAGVARLETTSFLRRPDGALEPRPRLLGPELPLDRPNVLAAARRAILFAEGAQEADGRFHYLVNPFTGAVVNDGFNIPRQAGTTLAICDAGGVADERSRKVALRSLAMLSSLVVRSKDRGGIVFPPGSKWPAGLGPSALTMVALLACRDRVGHLFDRQIGELGRGLLATQRPDGGFHPAWDPATGEGVAGQDQLYAAGQAVLALVLWEGARDLEKPAGVGEAIDRAMAYFSGPYWKTPIGDFFFLEENWHCLAARAGIQTSHRNDRYERWCIDYMTMKSRLVMDETSSVDDEFVGAYGFGDVLPPHHAATAGFAEALAAMIAVKHARDEPTAKDEALLAKCLGYMLKNQWREDNCAFCTRSLRIPGGFSENVGSPVIRIDFVQHALAAISHGGRELGLLEAREVSGPT